MNNTITVNVHFAQTSLGGGVFGGRSIKLWPWTCFALSLSLRCWRERCRFKAKTGKRRWPWSSSKTLYTVCTLRSNLHLTAFITAYWTSERRDGERESGGVRLPSRPLSLRRVSPRESEGFILEEIKCSTQEEEEDDDGQSGGEMREIVLIAARKETVREDLVGGGARDERQKRESCWRKKEKNNSQEILTHPASSVVSLSLSTAACRKLLSRLSANCWVCFLCVAYCPLVFQTLLVWIYNMDSW